MRLSFPNGEHADALIRSGTASLGTSDRNTIVIPGHDVAPLHARLTAGERRLVLEVVDGSSRTHVNCRPVRERALLRAGDTVHLGSVAMELKPDHDSEVAIPVLGNRADRSTPPTPEVVLRGLSGAYFGRSIPIRGDISVGSAPDCALVVAGSSISARHAVIGYRGDHLALCGSNAGAITRVNGIPVRDAVLRHDDQLAFGTQRFLVEAPGMDPRESGGKMESGTPTAGIDETTRREVSSRGGIWWLIGAAALIGFVLALSLLRGF